MYLKSGALLTSIAGLVVLAPRAQAYAAAPRTITGSSVNPVRCHLKIGPGTICSSGMYAVLQRENPSTVTPTCRQCDSSCAECTGATSKQCVACAVTGLCATGSCTAKKLYNNQCFDTCPAGSYESNVMECEGKSQF